MDKEIVHKILHETILIDHFLTVETIKCISTMQSKQYRPAPGLFLSCLYKKKLNLYNRFIGWFLGQGMLG